MGQQAGKIRQLNRILRKVRSYKDTMRALSDEELSHLTQVYKERLAAGETLDALLPEAYAAVCEADYRILGKFPYDAQVLGAIALHQGFMAEMNTGEGKTLVATMPLYLNALTGKSTILLTTNEYLVLRDAEEMGQVYRFMGLTISAGVSENPEKRFSNAEKKVIYSADIVYTTHAVLGFDYLLNNLVKSAQDRYMRDMYYVIIDEADSVMLDAAQTSLVISGVPRVQSNHYELANFFVTTLEEGTDYETEEKKVWLTDEGVRRAEEFFQIDNFYGKKFFEINRHVILALRAHVLFEKERDYMVSNKGELVLLDNASGRMMPGVKLRGGQHQAIEVKEGIEITAETRSMACITYQNLFLAFEKIAGMSGTISDAADELRDVYGKKVVVIPPNRPVQRKDLPDIYYSDRTDMYQDALEEVVRIHKTGQPVLVVVSTIAETEIVSALLMEEKIPHNVLNANNVFWEASIIKEAGQLRAVTVATSMAGRGTDIKLGEGVKELGGLAVIGIGRMENTRQERQARGRAGRQGDPGVSRFYVSIHDEIVKNNGPSNLDQYLEGKKHMSRRKCKRVINGAQKMNEEFAVMSRRHAVDYDQVLKKQREIMYQMRNKLLDGETVEQSKIIEIAGHNIDRFLADNRGVSQAQLNRYILDNISYRLDDRGKEIASKKREEVKAYLLDRTREALHEQEERLNNDDKMNEFMRNAMLTAIDDAWVEQVDYLQQLQAAVKGRSTAQRNPVYEYQKEALISYGDMKETIMKNIVRNVLLSRVQIDTTGKLQILLP